jgi:hypothetical protein
MNILILGATGFIGNAVFHALLHENRITIAGRTPLEGFHNWKKIDTDNLLNNIDIFINAVGIIEGVFNNITFKMFQDTSSSSYVALFPKVSEIIKPVFIKKGDTFPQLFSLLSISFIWIFSGIASLISWNHSYTLMNEIGANRFFSLFFMYLGSFIDIILGFAVFIKRYRKIVLVLQIIAMISYMLILSVLAPYYWLHPLGVLTKNIPLIALTYYLFTKQN